MAKIDLEKVKIKDKHHGLLITLMLHHGISQAMIVKATEVNKASVHRYVKNGFNADFWEKLRKAYGGKFKYIQKLAADQSKSDHEKKRRKEEKEREENESDYVSNVVREEMKERWAEQDRVNSELRVEVLKLRTEFETFKEQLNAPDAPSSKADIPSSDFLKDQDLLDEDPIDKKDLPRKKGKRKAKGE